MIPALTLVRTRHRTANEGRFARNRPLAYTAPMSGLAEAVIDSARQREVVAALSAFLPPHALLHAREDVQPYECDGLSAYRRLPMVVALPDTEDQVRDILRTCHRLRVPVVARGAGTGLSGGALPPADGVLLSLSRFMRILEIDPVSRTARLQPGVRSEEHTSELQSH